MLINILYEYIISRFIYCNRYFRKKVYIEQYHESIDIAICLNNSFLNPAIALIKSMENVKSNINLYVLNIELDKESIDLLKSKCPSNVHLEVIFVNKKELDGLMICEKWPVEAWVRILIPKYINSELVLYLDADCLIVDDITPIFREDYSNYLIAGVKSPIAKERSQKIGCDINGINSGVCIMNLVELRNFDFINKIRAYAKENSDSLIMPDQDSINFICKGRIKNISPEYNLLNICLAYPYLKLIKMIDDDYYTKKIYSFAKYHPKIIHFNGGPFERPWNKSILRNHPYKKLFNKYINE